MHARLTLQSSCVIASLPDDRDALEILHSSRARTAVLGAQHVAALGDLDIARGTVENVLGNFWSVGAAIVVR